MLGAATFPLHVLDGLLGGVCGKLQGFCLIFIKTVCESSRGLLGGAENSCFPFPGALLCWRWRGGIVFPLIGHIAPLL